MTTFQEALQKIIKVRDSGETRLRLCDLDAETLPEEIGELTALRHMSLDRGRLTRLPAALAKLTNLKSISAVDHQIEEFPGAILPLQALESVWLEGNKLTTIPDSISQLSNLQYLTLSRNSIGQLPRTIVQLSQLKRLDLSSNPLRELPEDIDRMSAIETINLYRTELQSLPVAISRLPNLKLLELLDCPATPAHLQHYFIRYGLRKLRGTEAVKHWLSGTPDPKDGLYQTLSDLRLPADLLSVLESGDSVVFDFDGASSFGSPPFTLKKEGDLKVEWLDVLGFDGVGSWCVPVVRLFDEHETFDENLQEGSFIMLWLPHLLLFGSYDQEDQSLYVFRKETIWENIASDFETYFFATHCCGPVDEELVTRVEEFES